MTVETHIRDGSWDWVTTADRVRTDAIVKFSTMTNLGVTMTNLGVVVRAMPQVGTPDPPVLDHSYYDLLLDAIEAERAIS